MKRLLMSRMRILCNNGFYGLLLMHMVYAIDVNCKTAATDGKRIYFGPHFLDELDDSELDFVMMHEILHVVLQHCMRKNDRDHVIFNTACDIVVNSNILYSANMDGKVITLRKYGVAMHETPDGKEGYKYTAEQVYEMLLPMSSSIGSKKNGGSLFEDCEGNSGGIGGEGDGEGENEAGGGDDGKDNGGESESGEGDAEEGNDGTGSVGGKKAGGGDTEEDSAEEGCAGENATGIGNSGEDSDAKCFEGWDDHTRWGTEKENEMLQDVWKKRFADACEAISIRDPSNQRGLLPLFAERLLKELKESKIDWRTILNDFVQEEIVDYSFVPPDRRFDESPFFLPDFNDKDDMVEDILFMIDTSGSMSDDMITAAYFEVKGAIDQFNGRLKGWLGFFDAAVVEPKPFEDENEFKCIYPEGGGGTDFGVIFEYVRKHMEEKPPVSIIILTDGYAPFPKEQAAGGIPVLWLINNEEVNPPWGKVARIVE